MRKIFLSLSLFLIYTSSFGCTCFSEVSIDSSFQDSEIIFQGKVIEIFKNKFYSYQAGATNIVNFEVTKNFKKTEVNGGTISLVDYRSSCGFTFELGREYIVFAYDIGGGHYFSSICTRTSLASQFDPNDLEHLIELSSNYKLDLNNHITAFVIDKSSWDQLNADLITQQSRVDELEHVSNIWKVSTLILGFLLVIAVIFRKRKQTTSSKNT